MRVAIEAFHCPHRARRGNQGGKKHELSYGKPTHCCQTSAKIVMICCQELRQDATEKCQKSSSQLHHNFWEEAGESRDSSRMAVHFLELENWKIRPPSAICTPRGCPRASPSGNLSGLGVQIASGGVFSNTPLLSTEYYYNTSLLSAVYCYNTMSILVVY